MQFVQVVDAWLFCFVFRTTIINQIKRDYVYVYVYMVCIESAIVSYAFYKYKFLRRKRNTHTPFNEPIKRWKRSQNDNKNLHNEIMSTSKLHCLITNQIFIYFFLCLHFFSFFFCYRAKQYANQQAYLNYIPHRNVRIDIALTQCTAARSTTKHFEPQCYTSEQCKR